MSNCTLCFDRFIPASLHTTVNYRLEYPADLDLDTKTMEL